MNRNAILGSLILATSACTGSLDGDQPPQPAPTDVQVVVRDGYAPQAGLHVTFQGPGGELLADAVTDGSGLATAKMPQGGSVTVVRTYPQPPPDDNGNKTVIPAEAYTYMAVKPGDRLVLGKPRATEGVPSAINIMVPKNTQGTVRVTSPCGTAQGQAPYIAMTIIGCSSDAVFYVADGQGASFAKRSAIIENVDFTAQIFKDSLSSSVNASNVPPGATVTIEKRVESDSYTLWSSGQKRVETTPAQVDMPTLADVDDVTIAMTTLDNRTQVFATRGTYSPGPTVVDVGANRIANIMDNPTYDDRFIQWTEDAPGTADVVITRIRVTRTTGTPQTPGPNLEFERILVAPYTGPSLQIPQIVGADAMYNPILNDQLAGALGIMKVTGGYDGVRAHALAVDTLADAIPMQGFGTLSYIGQAPTLSDR